MDVQFTSLHPFDINVLQLLKEHHANDETSLENSSCCGA